MEVPRFDHHHIYGQHLNKVLLTTFDSKRRTAENGVDALAYGYKDIHHAIVGEMEAYI